MQPVRREVGRTVWYERWFVALSDLRAKVAIIGRIDRVEDGNFGDHRAVGGGVSELRVHHGPGYRVYYAQKGKSHVLLLCGGTKGSQRQDIALAMRLWRDIRRGT